MVTFFLEIDFRISFFLQPVCVNASQSRGLGGEKSLSSWASLSLSLSLSIRDDTAIRCEEQLIKR